VVSGGGDPDQSPWLVIDSSSLRTPDPKAGGWDDASAERQGWEYWGCWMYSRQPPARQGSNLSLDANW
jgi:hypothetical protein